MLRRFIYGVTAGVVVAAGSTAGIAQASSAGCVTSNGCGTLHGTDQAGHQIAMDAKGQSSKPGTLIIGYPDNNGDPATSFDATLHYTPSQPVTSWADNAVTVFGTPDSTFTQAAVTAPVPLLDPPVTVTLTDAGVDTGLLNWTVKGGTGPYTITLNSTLPGAVVDVMTNYGTAAGVPAGDDNTATGTISVEGDALAEGVYNNLVLTVSDSYTYGNPPVAAAGTSTTTFAAKVYGNQVTSPSAAEAYYTFVYAKNGTQTNECVTDVNGSGALQLAACTRGKDLGQDFWVLAGDSLSGGSPVILGTGTYTVQNRLEAAVSAADSCLQDLSSLLPSTPQTNAVDETASPAGRQLRTDGSCTSNSWSWAS